MASIEDSNHLSRRLSVEREANEQIRKTHARVSQAQREASQALDHIHDQYERQLAQTGLQQTASLEKQKLRGYEAMRNLEQNQQQLIRKQRNEGDQRLLQLKKHHARTLHQLEQNYQERWNELKTENSHATHYEKELHDLQLQTLRDTYQKQLEDAQKEYVYRLQQAKNLNTHQLEQLKKEIQEASHLEEAQFQTQWNALKQKHEKALNHLHEQGKEKIRQSIEQNKQTLSKISQEQTDPFYQLVQLETHWTESPTSYQVKIWIPESEQKNLSLSFQEDRFLLSGFRRNEVLLEPNPGNVQQTASFQSFSESFPLEWPVEEKALQKEPHPDYLLVTLPKKRHPLAPS